MGVESGDKPLHYLS